MEKLELMWFADKDPVGTKDQCSWLDTFCCYHSGLDSGNTSGCSFDSCFDSCLGIRNDYRMGNLQ